MNIIVCVSLVPDSTTKVKISPDNKSLDQNGVSYILNPYDEFAVEEAVQLKEKNGGELTAVSFGLDKSKEAVKKAFQMGADKGVLIKPENDNFDSFTVAKNLAEYIKSKNPDIILFGKQSIDFDSLSIPNMVSELLGIPSINVVTKLTIEGSNVIAEREIEGGLEILETSLPVVIGTQKGINNPRYPNLKSIMASKSKPIEELKPTYTGNKTEITEMMLPVAKGKGKILEGGADKVAELVRMLREEAKVI
ncbi:MAG TPA: electron transfer flavoprotein subunit beta/FixA family protein [Ignavibacteria bacterium]|nr:electron transfer flavoprotein subunit beta/FixA family protein [Ignavibacteria bacterium]